MTVFDVIKRRLVAQRPSHAAPRSSTVRMTSDSNLHCQTGGARQVAYEPACEAIVNRGAGGTLDDEFARKLAAFLGPILLSPAPIPAPPYNLRYNVLSHPPSPQHP